MNNLKTSSAKGMLVCLLLLTSGFIFSTVNAQNLTKDQTIEYIDAKLKISDPVYSSFTVGDNGEAVMKWVNDGFYTEYRFNIREIEIELELSESGDNYISLTCIAGVNNCMQRARREDISKVGDKVSFGNYKTLNINSIAGFDNVVSLKNALKYLKILSDKDNISSTSSKRDPFLY